MTYYSGFYQSGDEVILLTILKLIRSVAKIQLSVCSKRNFSLMRLAKNKVNQTK